MCGFRPHGRANIVIADFEGKDYGDWKATGTAFGAGPAHGTLPNQQEVTGFVGKGLVNTHINVDQIVQSDRPQVELHRPEPIYGERYRPQFHFSPRTNWTNDPNGMVFYKGRYHLFFQHNPLGINWGNMTWGHAVVPDMFRTQHLTRQRHQARCVGHDLLAGTAVVDWENTAGFQKGKEKTIVCIYTLKNLLQLRQIGLEFSGAHACAR